MKYNKVINLVLGASMFMFGFLKFFNPFKGWYSVQMAAGQFDQVFYGLGIGGELTAGLALLLLTGVRQRISFGSYALFSTLASASVIVMMATATYVHLHPAVPADVLPLKIKPPIIPLFFLTAAIANIMILGKYYKLSKSKALL
ncbi:hypothetical protein WSM22_40840 [Cytophagales bacterium WSM2-2]|nr:hypothetical protein WSM22_40840 [Cytophagales bacterium WSM2-2]